MQRITGKNLLEEATHVLTHIDQHRFLRTIRDLLLRPGQCLHAYLSGRRKVLHAPFSFFIIWMGLEWLVRRSIIQAFDYPYIPSSFQSPRFNEAKLFFDEHATLFLFVLTPLIAGIIHLTLGRPRYTFFEMLVLTMYDVGMIYFLQLFLSTVLLGLLLHININSWSVGFYAAFYRLYGLWLLYDFFRMDGVKRLGWRLLLCYVLCAVVTDAVILFGPLLWF
ncbi:MAG TPA: DUF3667 domain-containing protein [Flavisolibacter sp.]|nr:DUF3667 domain-containing protein [Flavisolibacter sp.]